MVRARAAELALINGRFAHEASKSDWEQAKRELTGEPDTDPKEAVLESAPESERWDPVIWDVASFVSWWSSAPRHAVPAPPRRVSALCPEPSAGTLCPVMVRRIERMAICPNDPHADLATRPATPQPVRRHRMLRPPIHGELSFAPSGQFSQRIRVNSRKSRFPSSQTRGTFLPFALRKTRRKGELPLVG